jgi:hypothetical protein
MQKNSNKSNGNQITIYNMKEWLWGRKTVRLSPAAADLIQTEYVHEEADAGA